MNDASEHSCLSVFNTLDCREIAQQCHASSLAFTALSFELFLISLLILKNAFPYLKSFSLDQ